MNNNSYKMQGRREKSRCRYGQSGSRYADNGFPCAHCHAWVGAEFRLSGVQNRNHCPYCLWSRHLDLKVAGDRLSACKAPMKPIGLTVKATCKRYGSGQGELMLIHLCMECETLSINRIAADDDLKTVLGVFEDAFQMDPSIRSRLEAAGILALTSADGELVRARLFGHETNLAEILFSANVRADFITQDD
jgi:hypothetical protein